jgi:hypothetical protein
MSLEKAVETTDATDDTDGQGPGGSASPSAESAKSAVKGTAGFRMGSTLQHPVAGKDAGVSNGHPKTPFPSFAFFRFFRPRSSGLPLVPWPHPGRIFLPKRTKEDAEGFRLFPTHERGSDAMERHQTRFWIRLNVSPEK